MQQYELLNLKRYSIGTPKFVVSGPESKQFEVALRHTVENLHNPYVDFYHWCKNELFDIRAIKETIMGKKLLEDQKNRLEQNLRN